MGHCPACYSSPLPLHPLSAGPSYHFRHQFQRVPSINRPSLSEPTLFSSLNWPAGIPSDLLPIPCCVAVDGIFSDTVCEDCNILAPLNTATPELARWHLPRPTSETSHLKTLLISCSFPESCAVWTVSVTGKERGLPQPHREDQSLGVGEIPFASKARSVRGKLC